MMTYLIVAALVIFRVFGFAKTIAFFWAVFDLVTKGSIKEKKEIHTKEIKTQNVRWGNGAGASINANEAGRMPLTTPKIIEETALKPQPSSRLKQNSGRSSEEILSGKPDFGWRRRY